MNTLDELRRRIDGVTHNSRAGWDLKRKIKLFPPETEARCPYCEEWFPTNRIWLVDDHTNYLMGCWLPDGKPIPSDQIVHPHAWMSGEVCLGADSMGCKSASQALFAGIDKGKHVHLVPRWLYQLGHKCDKIPMNDCPICASKFHTDVEIYFGYRSIKVCSNDCLDIAYNSRCEECFCVIDKKENRFCGECAKELYIACSICSAKILPSESYYYSSKNLKCCYICHSKELRSCQECGFQERKVELNEDGICEICVNSPMVQCFECGGRFSARDISDITDSRCDYCRNFCDDCECSPCECDDDEEEENSIER